MRVDLQSVTISIEAKVVDALRIIDDSGYQVAMVVDQVGTLKGIITDGDIRRGLLRGLTLEAPVSGVMNSNPVTVRLDELSESALKDVPQNGRRHLPVVDAAGRLVALETVEPHQLAYPSHSCAVIMAGGLGTRLHPLTQVTPKPLLPIGNTPILEHIINHLIEQGIRRFYVSVNYKAHMIESYFGDGHKWGAEITYLHENDRLGTAGALGLLPEMPKHPFLLMNGDVMTSVNLKQMLAFHADQGASVTVGAFAHEYQVPYGVLKMEGTRVMAVQEKPVIRKFVSGGVYTLSPHVLKLVKPGVALDMPDLIQQLISSDQRVSAFPIHEYWIDIGRHDDLNRASREISDMFPIRVP